MAFNRRGQTSKFWKKNALQYSRVYIALWLSCTSPPSVQGSIGRYKWEIIYIIYIIYYIYYILYIIGRYKC